MLSYNQLAGRRSPAGEYLPTAIGLSLPDCTESKMMNVRSNYCRGSCGLTVLVTLLAACAPTVILESPTQATGPPASPEGQLSSTSAVAAPPTIGPLPTCRSSTATGCTYSPTSGTRALDLSHGTCTGEGSRRLIASPMRLSDIGWILPMGMMTGGHVTPIDHQYYYPADFHSAPDTYEVYSPMEGNIVVVGIDKEQVNPPDKISVIIEGSCTFWVLYHLLTSLTPELSQQALPRPGESSAVRIPVAAGQVIGLIGGRTLDFSVVSSEVTLSGFIVPEHYAAEAGKLHVVDPFDYFEEPLRSQLLALNMRTAEPLGGKIDYDIDGRLIGNWFIEGTNGYAGYFPDRQPRPANYSSTHLAIVPDGLDPSVYTISIGSLLPNEQNQFGILGNVPDPAQVSVGTGPVAFELVQIGYVDAEGHLMHGLDHFVSSLYRKDSLQVMGTVLMQLLEDRRLEVEVFMGRRASQVDGFTSAAVIYER